MMALFDQQKAVEQFGYEKMKEGETKGRKEGKLEGKLEQAKESAINMKKEGLSDSVIAKILNVGIEIVQQWIAGTTTVNQ